MSKSCFVQLVLACACVAFATGAAGNVSEDLSWGEVGLRVEAESDAVDPARDFFVNVTVDAPDRIAVSLPDLRTRLEGFATAESFLAEPVSSGGRKTTTQRWRLIPQPSAEYRLAPFAVEVRDSSSHPPATSWFATRPIVFPAISLDAPEGDPEVAAKASWIPPTLRDISVWIAIAAAALAILAAVAFLAMRIRRKVVEMRMSPRERALAELDRLLRRNLVHKGMYKDFYVELTHVVRRYIERAHGIRAAEQTTQEFLRAASGRPEFAGEVLLRLRAFLESADLVKFAGADSTPRMADDAVATAKDYVESDSAAAAACAAAPGDAHSPRQTRKEVSP